ncbi:MAG: FtsQ-type POTRA domain-containing protein [Betaproteobacteria bacterium]|nr:MAG: FtsQ-type POTRA domain-containing protein [Betaproteobacteria bacterium]RPI48764.1 MAG: FtsQ-type POTRA domain-containing protein [Betaproteobacteria bacterium]
MWDKPELLNAIANTLFGLAFLLVLYASFVFVVHLPVFPLREVRVATDPKFVQRSEIEAVVKRELRGTFFTLDLARARRGFETIAWVRKADLRRQWPDRIELRIEEHVPLARWGTMALVNAQGEVFAATYGGRLPVFNGPEGAAAEMAIQYAYFRKSLEPIGRVPVQVNVSARRAWSLRIEGGMTLELGRNDLESRLARFVQNYEHAATTLGRRIDYVDLRYANGFAVRVPELARAEAKEKRR